VLAWQVQVRPDHAFFADLVEVRDFIDPRAAEIAAERATAEERPALMRLQEEMEAADADPAASMCVDLALYAAILRTTHNGLAAQMTEAVITALDAGPVSAGPGPGPVSVFRASGGPESTNRARRLVVEAIGRADPAGARESMEALIALTARESGRVITATDVDGRSATGRNT
jgi:GntR family galactonate operon transcriptional repressor